MAVFGVVEPDEAEMVKSYVPGGVVGVVLMVIEVLRVPVVAKLTDTPVEELTSRVSPERVKLTCELNPLRAVTETGMPPMVCPAGKLCEEIEFMVKLGLAGVTVTYM